MLTSGEVQQLLEQHGANLGVCPEAPLDSLAPDIPDDGRLYGLPGGSGEGPLALAVSPMGAASSPQPCHCMHGGLCMHGSRLRN